MNIPFIERNNQEALTKIWECCGLYKFFIPSNKGNKKKSNFFLFPLLKKKSKGFRNIPKSKSTFLVDKILVGSKWISPLFYMNFTSKISPLFKDEFHPFLRLNFTSNLIQLNWGNLWIKSLSKKIFETTTNPLIIYIK